MNPSLMLNLNLLANQVSGTFNSLIFQQNTRMLSISGVDQVFLGLGAVGITLVVVLLSYLLKLGNQRTSLSNLGGYSRDQENLENQELRCCFPYEAQVYDEISAAEGDRVFVISCYDDGWVRALNINTGKKGILPLICLKSA